MAWGLEVPDEWLPVIDALCAAIDHPYSTSVKIGETTFDHDCPQVVADQVKEKFNGLRFYYHLESTPELDLIRSKNAERYYEIENLFRCYVDGAISMAEKMVDRIEDLPNPNGKAGGQG